jgi:hypothetical protein
MSQSRARFLAFAAALAGCSSQPRDLPTVPPPPPSIPIGIIVGPSAISLPVGTTVQMAAATPRYPNASWLWAVSDTALADISTTGLLLGKSLGPLAVSACLESHPLSCGFSSITIVAASGTPASR